MLRMSHLEVGTLASFLRLALARGVTFPIAMDQFRNGALGQHWIQSAHRWQPGQRVIDVGCGYSDLPNLLTKAGCEVWGADDFGLKSGDPYWLRGKHPDELAKQFPDVRYVFERLGEIPSSFPANYFDVVISNQALHVAKPPHAAIWRDMLRVMKKSAGSEMLVSMICNFASDGRPDDAIARLRGIRDIERDILGRTEAGEIVPMAEFDALQETAGQSFHRFSPALYVVYVLGALGAVPCAIPEELLAENFCTRVNSLLDPASVGFNNARFSSNPDEAKSFRYGRYAPVLMRLVWGHVEDIPDPLPLPPDLGRWQTIGARIVSAPVTERYAGQHGNAAGCVLLIESTDDSVHMMATETDLPADRKLRLSVLARPKGRSFLGFWLRGPKESEDTAEVFFDLEAAKVSGRTRYGNATFHDAGIEPAGDGWMRCSVSATPSAAGGNSRANVLLRDSADGSSRYAGNGNGGICLANLTFERES